MAATYRGQALGLPPTGVNALAGAGERLAARLLDGVIVLVAAAVAGVITALLVAAGNDSTTDTTASWAVALVALLWIAFAIGFVLYDVAFVTVRGATPGKRIMHMRVAQRADGRNPSWGKAVLRWLLPLVMSFVCVANLLDALWLLWDDNRQCLHDKVADTVVVKTA